MEHGTYRSKKRVGFRLLGILLAFCMILVGCGSKTEDKSADTSTDNKSAVETTRTVKHAMGETTIKGEPKRIVVLTNEGTEALLALGIKPVGAVKSWTGDPWYPHIAKQMEGVTVVGEESQPNLEAIAALQPDLIIGNKMRQEKVYDQLSAIAPTVFSETLRGEWKPNFKFYADALNKKAEGDKILADWDKKVADFKAKVGDGLKTQVSMVRFMPGKTRIYYDQTFSGIILKELGVARPAAQMQDKFADDVTKERIPEMDGDILFYFTYETGNGQATKLEQEWLNDSLFKNLNVVKKGNIYKVDDTTWNTSGGVLSANIMVDELQKYLTKK